MLILDIGGKEYTLKTTLGVVKTLESKSKKTLNELMAEFAKGATVDEMLATLKAGCPDKDTAEALEKDILDNCDLVTIQKHCDEFFIRLCFGGTPEEQEEKIEAFPASPRRKNLIRKALGLPEKEIPSTSEGSSAPAIV
jgi:hypothetical protein